MAFVNRGQDISKHTFERIACRTCTGGTITEEQARRIIIGKARRDLRVSQRVSLFEAAKAAGLSPADLSAREMGRGPVEWYVN